MTQEAKEGHLLWKPPGPPRRPVCFHLPPCPPPSGHGVLLLPDWLPREQTFLRLGRGRGLTLQTLKVFCPRCGGGLLSGPRKQVGKPEPSPVTFFCPAPCGKPLSCPSKQPPQPPRSPTKCRLGWGERGGRASDWNPLQTSSSREAGIGQWESWEAAIASTLDAHPTSQRVAVMLGHHCPLRTPPPPQAPGRWENIRPLALFLARQLDGQGHVFLWPLREGGGETSVGLRSL